MGNVRVTAGPGQVRPGRTFAAPEQVKNRLSYQTIVAYLDPKSIISEDEISCEFVRHTDQKRAHTVWWYPVIHVREVSE